MRNPRHRTIALVAVAAVTMALGACSSEAPVRPDAAAGQTSVSPSGPASSDVAGAAGLQRVRLSTELDHAHGLVVTADGTLLAGTHTGVVSIRPNGASARVGTVDDDLMGMTGVPGTKRLISSGHPGPKSRMPNPLGLMSSDDGGASWQPLSLAGQIDFHALATDGRLITGFDGMRGIRLSHDGGRTWTPGAALAAAALAMSRGSVWATTEQGLQRSVDGGKTFTVVGGAPLLRLIAAGSDDSLWGVDLKGYAWRSRDGLTWERRAAVGQIDAIAVADHANAYAITAEQLHILS